MVMLLQLVGSFRARDCQRRMDGGRLCGNLNVQFVDIPEVGRVDLCPFHAAEALARIARVEIPPAPAPAPVLEKPGPKKISERHASFTVLEHLQREQNQSAAKLAESTGFVRDTVQRSLVLLQEQGQAKITGGQGKAHFPCLWSAVRA